MIRAAKIIWAISAVHALSSEEHRASEETMRNCFCGELILEYILNLQLATHTMVLLSFCHLFCIFLCHSVKDTEVFDDLVVSKVRYKIVM